MSFSSVKTFFAMWFDVLVRKYIVSSLCKMLRVIQRCWVFEKLSSSGKAKIYGF